MAAVEPHFERRFIRHSYACRKGGGTHRAAADMQRHLRRAEARWGRVYALQIDISKYFPSIQHDRLLEQIARTISDRRVLTIWERIIRGAGRDVGLPIGALTSQLSGNIYLDWLDHMVKDEMGVKGYARYMDDAVLLLTSKDEAWRTKRLLEDLLRDELGLKLSKALVYPTTQGVDWAGYRTWSTHMLPRRKNIVAARRRLQRAARLYGEGRMSLEEVRQRVASFVGHTQHCDAARVTQSVIDDVVLIREAA
ncbi:reverse transcriptase domain-containing protein [Halorhodospira halophila]|uniref:reverse transcriptase domain-containing protein n=1 Tax=Halorhodospira halophila TaxID=1053 RepID=UPI0031F60362